MSRGHGKVERWLLENLPAYTDNVVYREAMSGRLTLAFYGEAKEYQKMSMRRALRRLEEQGLIVSRRPPNWRERTPYWTLTALSKEERLKKGEEIIELRRKIRALNLEGRLAMKERRLKDLPE